MKALVILDVQNDFMPGGALQIPQGDLVVPVINRLQERYDLVVATQDWHPANHMSFASSHPGKKPFDVISSDGIEQILWPDHCVQSSAGASFHRGLRTEKIAAIFRKGMNPRVDSYSGFYDNLHKISTGMAGYFTERGVSELHFCGLAGDICVYYTIRDSLKEGFSSVLIDDATRPLNRNSYEKIKEELSGLGVKIISSNQVLNDQIPESAI